MSWTWEELRSALTRLALPDGQYVVGLSGALLGNESVAAVDDVELLVTDDLCGDLERRGWIWDERHGRLLCPSEDGLFVRTGDAGDTYRATIAELLTQAWHQDGVPLVSMVQVEPTAVQSVVDQTATDADDQAPYLAWTWERLSAVLPGLDLPVDEYVVGLSGAMLANESVEAVEEVVLLVTDELHGQLARRGWVPDESYGLECPSEPDLFVRTGDVSDTYRAPIPDLLAEAWHEDGIPLVSMMQIDQGAVRSFLGH